MSTAATRALAEAVALVESDLGLVLEYRAVLLPESLHPPILDAWPTIRRRIAELRNLLLEAPDTIDERLEAAGLTGIQLDMKLGAHRAASNRAREAGPPSGFRPPIGFRRLFKSLLGWINVWLGSLVAAMGAGEALKEFKEYLEQAVDDVENLA